MWKKGDVPAHTPASSPEAPPRKEAAPRPERPAPSGPSLERATIGRSITIRGEVTGDEDLLIQGRVDGSVDLKQHAVTVGPEGEVKASIVGRVVTIEGRVEGNLSGDEQVILRSSAWVEGDITAPRVVLEDGAHFRGGVDMAEVSDRGKRAGTAPAARREPEPVKTPPPSAEKATEKGKSASDATAEVAR